MNSQLLVVEQMLNAGVQPTQEYLREALNAAKTEEANRQAVIADMQTWLGKLLYAHLLEDAPRIFATLERLKNQRMLVIPTDLDTIH